MRGKRKNYRPDFQAKVFLEAVKENKTLSEIGDRYKIHPNLVTKWKKKGLELLPSLFENSGNISSVTNYREEELLQEIGRLSVENEFLKKKPFL